MEPRCPVDPASLPWPHGQTAWALTPTRLEGVPLVAGDAPGVDAAAHLGLPAGAALLRLALRPDGQRGALLYALDGDLALAPVDLLRRTTSDWVDGDALPAGRLVGVLDHAAAPDIAVAPDGTWAVALASQGFDVGLVRVDLETGATRPPVDGGAPVLAFADASAVHVTRSARVFVSTGRTVTEVDSRVGLVPVAEVACGEGAAAGPLASDPAGRTLLVGSGAAVRPLTLGDAEPTVGDCVALAQAPTRVVALAATALEGVFFAALRHEDGGLEIVRVENGEASDRWPLDEPGAQTARLVPRPDAPDLDAALVAVPGGQRSYVAAPGQALRPIQRPADDLAAVAAGFAELCNGVDEDCDGELDEGFDPPETPLGGECVGFCGAGRRVCTADGLRTTCSTNGDAPGANVAPERCDGEDNDCDGDVDEELGVGLPCEEVGVCAGGLMGCGPDGDVVCERAGPERCNGLDDDCDGATDEEIPVGDLLPVSADGVTATGGRVARGAEGEVGVVWSEERLVDDEIAQVVFFRRYDTHGGAWRDDAPVQVSTGGGAIAPDLAWDGAHWGVAWTEQDLEGAAAVQFTRIDTEGEAPVAEPARTPFPDAPWSDSPAIAAGANRWVIIARVAGDGEIVMARRTLRADGVPLEPEVVRNRGRDMSGLDVAFDGRNFLEGVTQDLVLGGG